MQLVQRTTVDDILEYVVVDVERLLGPGVRHQLRHAAALRRLLAQHPAQQVLHLWNTTVYKPHNKTTKTLKSLEGEGS